jgi:hypothetical protein
VGRKFHSASAGGTEHENARDFVQNPCSVFVCCSDPLIRATIDRLGQVERVPDKKDVAALKEAKRMEAKRMLDDLYERLRAGGRLARLRARC